MSQPLSVVGNASLSGSANPKMKASHGNTPKNLEETKTFSGVIPPATESTSVSVGGSSPPTSPLLRRKPHPPETNGKGNHDQSPKIAIIEERRAEAPAKEQGATAAPFSPSFVESDGFVSPSTSPGMPRSTGGNNSFASDTNSHRETDSAASGPLQPHPPRSASDTLGITNSAAGSPSGPQPRSPNLRRLSSLGRRSSRRNTATATIVDGNRLNIDAPLISEGEARLPVLFKEDEFAAEVLGILQACADDPELGATVREDLGKSLGVFPFSPDVQREVEAEDSGSPVLQLQRNERQEDSRDDVSSRKSDASSVTPRPAMETTAVESDEDSLANTVTSLAGTARDIQSSILRGGHPQDASVRSPYSPAKAVDSSFVGFSERLASASEASRPRTLREAEMEEREEIISLFNELMVNLKWEFMQGMRQVGDLRALQSAASAMEQSFIRFWQHRMQTVLELNFTQLFPLGLAETSFTALDTAALLEAFLAIEPLMTDYSLSSLGFFEIASRTTAGVGGRASPANAQGSITPTQMHINAAPVPGTVLESAMGLNIHLNRSATVRDADTSPGSSLQSGYLHSVSVAPTAMGGGRLDDAIVPQQRPYFHAFLAAKCALQLLGGGITIEEVRDLVVTHFHHPTSVFLPGEMVAIMAIASAARLSMSRPERQELVQTLHKRALQVERKLQARYEDPDNTIGVEYQRGEVCGRGSYGTVYRCLNIVNGKFLALKELPLFNASEDREQLIRVEIDTLKSLSHEHIIKYFGCKFDRVNNKVAVLMEYAPKSLRDVVDECKGLTLSLIAHYCRKVLKGLAYLHNRGMVHRDIKAANVLVTDSGEVKLSDFGCAVLRPNSGTDLLASSFGPLGESTEAGHNLVSVPTELLSESARDERHNSRLRQKMAQHQQRRQLVGTPLFMAPEILQGAYPSDATDIWAFGCMLIELVTGKHPWFELLSRQAGHAELELVIYQIAKANKAPTIPDSLQRPKSFDDFLHAALDLDATKRATAEELLAMPFLMDDDGGLGSPQPSGGSQPTFGAFLSGSEGNTVQSPLLQGQPGPMPTTKRRLSASMTKSPHVGEVLPPAHNDDPGLSLENTNASNNKPGSAGGQEQSSFIDDTLKTDESMKISL